MTKEEFENLKAGDTVYILIYNYETGMTVVEKYTAVGRCESEIDWIVKPFNRDTDYSWANNNTMFLTRQEAEKAAIDSINERIEDNEKDIERIRQHTKRLEDNLLKFQQSCIELRK